MNEHTGPPDRPFTRLGTLPSYSGLEGTKHPDQKLTHKLTAFHRAREKGRTGESGNESKGVRKDRKDMYQSLCTRSTPKRHLAAERRTRQSLRAPGHKAAQSGQEGYSLLHGVNASVGTSDKQRLERNYILEPL
ncbi:hypothetical protein AOLI_G00168830 [Acnodon oligacanthus]